MNGEKNQLMRRNLDIIGDRNYFFCSYLDAFAWINNEQFVKTAKYVKRNRTLVSARICVDDIWKCLKAHVAEAGREAESII